MRSVAGSVDSEDGKGGEDVEKDGRRSRCGPRMRNRLQSIALRQSSGDMNWQHEEKREEKDGFGQFANLRGCYGWLPLHVTQC